MIARAATALCCAPLLALAALAALATSCRSTADKADCAKMMDRYIDLAIAEEPPLGPLSPEQTKAVREMKRALKRGEKGFKKVHDRCEAAVTRKEYSCAMDAKTTKEWETCIQ